MITNLYLYKIFLFFVSVYKRLLCSIFNRLYDVLYDFCYLNIVFITNDLRHKRFVRNGYDLITTYSVTLKQMMCGVRCVVNTLDHKQLNVNITQLITYVLIGLNNIFIKKQITYVKNDRLNNLYSL